MPEGNLSSGGNKDALEAEIADLSRIIEEKRHQLEKEGVEIEEKETVRTALSEKVNRAVATPATGNAVSVGQQTPSKTDDKKSYLDNLSPETVEVVNSLIQVVYEKGISSAIEEAANKEPYIIDAFHDALVDKMYNELRERGIVK